MLIEADFEATVTIQACNCFVVSLYLVLLFNYEFEMLISKGHIQNIIPC